MLAGFRIRCQATFLAAKLILLGLLFSPQHAFANAPQSPPANPGIVMECSASRILS